MGFLTNIGKSLVSFQNKVSDTKLGKALDITAAIAKNPLAILAPNKAAADIKLLRTTGTTAELKSYIKTTAVQTGLNVATVGAGAGYLGAAGKAAATKFGTKALTIGAVATPFIVGSPTIRKTIASTSPVEIGIKSAEKLETAIGQGSKTAETTAKVLGTIAAGAVGAGVIIAGKEIYEQLKTPQEKETSFTITPAPTAQLTPVTPQTTTKSETTTTKRRKAKKKREVPYINIKIDNREDNDFNDRKIYKGGVSKK